MLIFVKRRMLLPMMRWLYEYSLENFRRQQRINTVLFACIEELAIENARLRQALESAGRRPRRARRLPRQSASDPPEPRAPMKLACVVHRFGADIAGGSEAHCRHVAEHLAARARRHHPHHVREGSHHLAQRVPGGRSRLGAADGAALSGRASAIAAPVHRHQRSRLQRHGHRRRTGASGSAKMARTRRSCSTTCATTAATTIAVLFWAFRYAEVYFGLPLVADRAILVPTAEEDPLIRMDDPRPVSSRCRPASSS